MIYEAMISASLKWLSAGSPAFNRIRGLPVIRAAFIVTMLIGITLLAIAGHSYSPAKLVGVVPSKHPANLSVLQGKSAWQTARLHDKLSFQPVADRFRRLLGQRFVASGKEMSVLIGTLTVETKQYQVRIVRTQNDDGEQVAISLNGGLPSLTWNGKQGAFASDAPATASERVLTERLALDSCDQFVLAQLRSSYRTVARDVVPKGAGEIESYSGSSWDVVLVRESDSASNKPLSTSRLYYLNNATGLLDRVVSREDGEAITAEFFRWESQGSEKVPTHITWTRNSQVVMQLDLSGASYGPHQ